MTPKFVRKPRSKSTEFYVDDAKFLEEIVKYKAAIKEAEELGTEKPRITNYLGDCITKISTRLSYSPQFIGYSFRDEMVGDGIENAIMYFDRFDPNKAIDTTRITASGRNFSGKISPFNYFTQIIWFAFTRRIMKEEKQRYIKYKHFQENVAMSVDHLEELDGFDPLQSQTLYDNINQFMAKFEKRELEKKAKREEKKLLDLENDLEDDD